MANMSYCRFHNTRIDLEGCLDALRDGEKLSADEYKAFKRMFTMFFEYLYDEGIIEQDEETDENLQDFFNTIKNFQCEE